MTGDLPAMKDVVRGPHPRPLSGGEGVKTEITLGVNSQITLGVNAEITLGVMGGGQLGRMFVHAAQQMGFRTAVLDADPQSPAGLVSHHHIQTGYDEAQGLAQLADVCAAVTTEFENVPAPALQTLAARCTVAPGAAAVAIAQDRIAEKAHFVRCGVPLAPYAVIQTPQDLAAVPASLLPGILKTARMGYDGKGQARVATADGLAAAWQAMTQVPCVLEQLLPLASECSVIVARGADGTVVSFPVQRNLHRDGILAVTEVYESNLPSALVDAAQAATCFIANKLSYVGVLCVEFFVLEPGSPQAVALGPLVVNEMAPRPHNSGHYTLDACDLSQFDLQVRTLAGLPLVQPRQHSPAIMLNLLGDLWLVHGTTPVEPPWPAVLALPGAHLHLYGKSQPRVGRKMGHLTFTGPDVSGVQATTQQAADILGLAPW